MIVLIFSISNLVNCKYGAAYTILEMAKACVRRSRFLSESPCRLFATLEIMRFTWIVCVSKFCMVVVFRPLVWMYSPRIVIVSTVYIGVPDMDHNCMR